MKRIVIGLLGLVSFIFLIILGVSALSRLHLTISSFSRVYSVAEVQAGMQQEPRLWAGRTVLVQGDVKMSPNIVCNATNPICQSTMFIYLGPSHSPPLNQTQEDLMLRRLNMVMSMARAPSSMSSSVSRQYTLMVSTISALIGGGMPNLLLQVPPNVPVPIAQPHGVLPDSAYTLPIVGPLLEDVFPLDNRLIVRVRLASSAACRAQSFQLCVNGVLLRM